MCLYVYARRANELALRPPPPRKNPPPPEKIGWEKETTSPKKNSMFKHTHTHESDKKEDENQIKRKYSL